MIITEVGSSTDIGGGLHIHHHEAGEGPVVVFLHGSGPGASGYSNFKGNYRELAAAGFRCLVPDALGYGASSKPPEAKYTLDYLCDATLAWLEALGVQRFSLVGNSMGGALAIKLALDHPDRVERLVLMAPGGLEPRETYMAMRGIRRMLKCIFGPDGITREGIRKVFELQLHDPGLLDDATLEERYATAVTQPRAVFETSRVPNQAARVGELQCPVFVLWGMNDQFCPPSGAWTFATGATNCRVLTLSECGHWVMVEQRELFNKLCAEFLQE